MKEMVTICGAGLAGCEAAWQAVRHGVPVRLLEMKPNRYTPAHHAPTFAELVCSNSLRSNELTNAVGLLKEEMRRMGSLIMEAADATSVPAGGALAVNRYDFSSYVTDKIKNHPLICVEETELTELPEEGICVIATGPLTTDELSEAICRKIGRKGLHFFDAAAPIVDGDSIDFSIAFRASRYGKGDSDYVNLPLNEEEYAAFYDALIHAETAQLKEFDAEAQREPTVFEGCMPVEVMAKRGVDTLRYGPMKPVGITDPRTGKEPYALVQLRCENISGTMYNLVGFQTHLTFPEQRRVFGMLPGLQNAAFLRYGVMHRNTYLDSPGILTPCYALSNEPRIFFAGQMTGVEGYLESAASGFVAGESAAMRALGREPIPYPTTMVIGALGNYVSRGTGGAFQPMNANFGIVDPLETKVRGGKRARNEAIAARSLGHLEEVWRVHFDG